MSPAPLHLTPERWLASVFAGGEVARGGVIRRQIRDVERLAGRAAFLAEVDRRGFQLLENGRHFIIICNREPVRRLR